MDDERNVHILVSLIACKEPSYNIVIQLMLSSHQVREFKISEKLKLLLYGWAKITT